MGKAIQEKEQDATKGSERVKSLLLGTKRKVINKGKDLHKFSI